MNIYGEIMKNFGAKMFESQSYWNDAFGGELTKIYINIPRRGGPPIFNGIIIQDLKSTGNIVVCFFFQGTKEVMSDHFKMF